METTEKTYVVRLKAVDEYGNETPSVMPIKSHSTMTEADVIAMLDKQYPHLKHHIESMEELKSPEQVEDWHHSYMGVIFGEDMPNKEKEEEE
jgi:hypothetical protein